MKRYQLSITIFFLLCALLPGFAQQTKTLTLLQTSDTHSRIEPIDVHAADKYAGMGGFVRRAALLDQFREVSNHACFPIPVHSRDNVVAGRFPTNR